MKKLITILLLAISGFASAQTYQLNYPDIRIGNSNTGKIVLRGSNVQFPFLALGSTTDSVLTIVGGVIKKVPRSQFSSGGSYTFGNGVQTVSGVTGLGGAITSTAYMPFTGSGSFTVGNSGTQSYLGISPDAIVLRGRTTALTTNSALTLSGSLASFYFRNTGVGDIKIDMNTSGMTITDAAISKGAKYALDYTKNWTDADSLRIPNKKYVDSLVLKTPANALKENTANKQNSLTADGSGVKFPTVDAVNTGLATKQGSITLTTTGASGASTLIGNTLNIPQYAGATYSAGNGITFTGAVISADTSIVATNANTLSLAETFTRFGSGNFYPQPAVFTGGGTSTSDYFNIIGATGVSGTGNVLMGTSPILVTPTLGVATGTTFNKVTITPPTTNATLTLVQGSTLATAGAFSNTITTTANTTVTFPTTGTLYGTATGSITSAQLLGSLSNETGTGAAVFGTTPTIATPNLTGITTAASIAMSGGIKQPISTKTGAYTIVLTDYTLLANATTAAFTISLPTAASASGYVFNVKKIDVSANAVTVQANGAELIDGVNTKVLSSSNQSIQIQSNGTSWYIL